MAAAGFRNLVSKIKNNSCNYKTVNLTEYELDFAQLEALNASIYSNHIVGRIVWGGERQYDPAFVKSVNDKIALNNKEYKYYPTPYEYALLSDDVYKKGQEVEVSESDLQDEDLQEANHKVSGVAGWEVIDYNVNSVTGFASAVYKNPDYCQMVLAYRGSESNLHDFIGGDWQFDINTIFLNQNMFEGQVLDSYSVSKEAIKKYQEEGYSFSFTGHSLGGWLANLNLFLGDAEGFLTMSKSVTFDAPGIGQAISLFDPSFSYNGFGSDKVKHLDISNYMSYPNFVNTIYGHIGKKYLVRNDIVNDHKVSDNKNKDLLSFLKSMLLEYYDSLYTNIGHMLAANIIPGFNSESGFLDKGNGCEAVIWPSVGLGNYKDYRVSNKHRLKEYKKELGEKLKNSLNNNFKEDIKIWIEKNSQTMREKCVDLDLLEFPWYSSPIITKESACRNLPKNVQKIILEHSDIASKILLAEKFEEVWNAFVDIIILALGLKNWSFAARSTIESKLAEEKKFFEEYCERIKILVEEDKVPLEKTLHYVLSNVIIGFIEGGAGYDLKQYLISTSDVFRLLNSKCPTRKESTDMVLHKKQLDFKEINYQESEVFHDIDGINYQDKLLQRIKHDSSFVDEERSVKREIDWLKSLYEISGRKWLISTNAGYKAEYIKEYSQRIVVDLYPDIKRELDYLYLRELPMEVKLKKIKEKVSSAKELSRKFSPNNILYEGKNKLLQEQVELLINDQEVKEYFANKPDVSELLSYLWLQYSMVNSYMWNHDARRVKESLLSIKEQIKEYVISSDRRLEDRRDNLDDDKALIKEIAIDGMKALLIKVVYSLGRSYFYLKHNKSHEQLVEMREEAKKYLESVPELAREVKIEGGGTLEDMFEVHLSRANALYWIKREEAENLIKSGKNSEAIELLEGVIDLYIGRITDDRKYKLDYDHEANYKPIIVPSENEYALAECYEQMSKCYLDLALISMSIATMTAAEANLEAPGSKEIMKAQEYFNCAVGMITGNAGDGNPHECQSRGVNLRKITNKKGAAVLNTLSNILFKVAVLGEGILDYEQVKEQVEVWLEKHGKKLAIDNQDSDKDTQSYAALEISKYVAYIAKDQSKQFDHTRADACFNIAQIAKKQLGDLKQLQQLADVDISATVSNIGTLAASNKAALQAQIQFLKKEVEDNFAEGDKVNSKIDRWLFQGSAKDEKEVVNSYGDKKTENYDTPNDKEFLPGSNESAHDEL